MPDSRREKIAEYQNELKRETREAFEEKYNFSLEDVKTFVTILKNDRFQELLKKYFDKTEKVALSMAFPDGDELLSYKGYMGVRGTVDALRSIKFDFESIVSEYEEYKEKMDKLFLMEER
jgi:hypothetical protein